jgi:drug/metabolite transporter (DMT)-like permease
MHDQPPPPPRWKVIAFLTVGVLAMSSASILVRFAFLAGGERSFALSLLLGAGRLLLASALLLPAWIALFRRRSIPPRAVGLSFLSGVALALHFATWFTSLAYTTVTASTVLVTLGPVWTAIIGTWLGIERLSLRSWVGILLALAGALFIGVSDSQSGAIATASDPILGDLLAFIGGVMAAVYRLLGRGAQRGGLAIGAYSAVAYGVGGLLLLPGPAIFGLPAGLPAYTHFSGAFYFWLVALAVIPQLIGHTSANWAVRWFSPTLISVLVLFEPVAGSVLAWVFFGEAAGPAVWLGGGVLLVGVAIATSRGLEG